MLKVPKADDFHVHLRQGNLCSKVTPMVTDGGVKSCLVMPNCKPPITTCESALKYRNALKQANPHCEYWMTLYLCPELTVEELKKAKEAGIVGVKSYPRGVTTNSDSGIESYTVYYPLFEAMESLGLVLNLHGEIPSDPANNVCVLNAEELFLKHLVELHSQFPKLKIVLEHATTKAAVETVKSLGDTVGCTITLHHLQLLVDDWAGCCHHFCKPVAKYPHDRDALRQVILQGHPRFFMGTDSAPHPRHLKESAVAPAGVFVTPLVMPYLATLLDSFGALDRLADFSSRFGRRFYGLNIDESDSQMITLVQKEIKVPEQYEYVDEQGQSRAIVPFLAGKSLKWSIQP